MNTQSAPKASNKLTEILLSGITKPCDMCSNTKCNSRKVYKNMQTKNEPKTVNDYLELTDRCVENSDTKKARECLKKANALNGKKWDNNKKEIEKLIEEADL